MPDVGLITDVQHFSLHDGPGVRTTVFFAGCGMRCKWCHNPETFFSSPRLQFFKYKCRSCGDCAAVCPSGALARGPVLLNRNLCYSCFACVSECVCGALRPSCRKVDTEPLLKRLIADSDIYAHTGGGVTFSGGEPFLQTDFLYELAAGCRRNGVHTVIETAANADYSEIARVLPLVDIFICDFKAADDALHKRGTGVSNKRIIENIRFLYRDSKELWVRIPLIPGFNDSIEELERIADTLLQIGHMPVEVLPFHALGAGKYETLGIDCEIEGLLPLPDTTVSSIKRFFVGNGFPEVG